MNESNEFQNVYEMMKTCGDIHKTYKDYRCYINHFGMYDSESVLNFQSIYSSIVLKVKMPIDWGGCEFDLEDLALLCMENKTSIKQFLPIALDDGMIRYSEVNKKNLTITGKCYTVMTCINNQFHISWLSPLIEKKKDFIYLFVGDNTLYPKEYNEMLVKLGFEFEGYWYYCKVNDTESVKQRIKSLLEFFLQLNNR